MILDLANRFGLDLSRSWVMGDRWVDVLAGSSAGCRTVLIESPESWSRTSSGESPSGLKANAKAQDCLDAARVLLSHGLGAGRQ